MERTRIGYDPETGRYYNPVTGEVLDGMPVFFKKPSGLTQLYGESFVAMNQNALISMATDKDITLEHHRVLMYLFGCLDFNNYIQVPQIEIAKVLGMQRPNVSRALSMLISKGILIEGPKIGRTYSFRLNPNYGYKGNPKGKVSRDQKSMQLHLVKN